MKHIINRLTLLTALLISGIGFSQMPYIDTAWVEQSPEVSSSIYHTASIVHQGQLVMTGNKVTGSGDTDVFTFMLDSNGDTAWTATESGSLSGGNDYGVDLGVNASGDIIVVAAIENSGSSYDYAVYQYDGTTGSQDWSYEHDGTGGGIDIPASIKIYDAIDAIYVSGGSQESGSLYSDYGMLKLDLSGNLEWAKYYDNANLHDAAYSASSVSFGTYVFFTGASETSVGSWDLIARMLYASDGSVFNTASLGATGVELVEATAMTTDSLNNTYITGFAESGGDKYIQTVKIDSNFSEVWVVDYDASHDDVGNDVAVDTDGNVYVTGYTEISSGKSNAILIKYDEDGNELWTREFGETESSSGGEAKKIALNDDGEVFITGTLTLLDETSSFFFNQYSDDGGLLLSTDYQTLGISDSAYDIHVDADTVYVTGISGTPGGSAMTAVKYVLLQDVNANYFYLNDEKSYWCQQPGMYSFAFTDSSEYTGYMATSTVTDTVVFGEGIHYVYFDPTASEDSITAVIDSIEAHPKFYKEYMVATMTRHNDQPHEKEYYAGLDNYISIVFEDPNLTITEVDSFAALYETSVVFEPGSSISGGVYILLPDRTGNKYNLSSSTLTMEIARDMEKYDSLDFVSKVTPSLRLFRPDDPDDPLYPDMWWAEDDVAYSCNGTEVYPVSIDLDCAWNFNYEINDGPSYSGDGVVVAVIDYDAAQYSHPDCNGMYDNGYVTPSSTSTDVIIPIYGDTYVSNKDFKAHLQNVSGIIGARIDNDEGIAGVAHGSTVMPCLFEGASGQFNTHLMKILEQTLEDEVDIVNMSFGYGGLTPAEAIGYPFYESLEQCHQFGRPTDGDGIVLVASAGNDDTYKEQVPAAIPFVLSVGATTPWDERKEKDDNFDPASGTKWGSTYFDDLDVAAPGICIVSTDHTDDNHPAFPDPYGDGYTTGDYYSFSGTSASAPIVSGIAALLLEKNASLSADEVYNAIRFSCEKVGGYTYTGTGGSSRCLELGYGRVNACDALDEVTPLSTDENEYPQSFVHPNPVTDQLNVSVKDMEDYTVTIIGITGNLVYRETSPSSKRNFVIDMQNYAPGMYYLILSDDSGNTISSKIVKE